MTDTTTAPEQQPVEHTGLEQCAQCEQTDNHPKVHVLGRDDDGNFALITHHLDCLPRELRRQAIDAAPHMEAAYHAVLHDAVRGDALRTLIADIHDKLAAPAQPGTAPTQEA